MIEQIKNADGLLAIIIRRKYETEGIRFLTPDDFSQQLAYMKRPSGYRIEPHVHNKIQRQVFYTQEVLILKKGKLRVDFYDNGHNYLESRILGEGDVILLADGGHGFEVLEEIEVIEVKQGPYSGDMDKTRFEGIPSSHVRVTEG